MQPPSTLTKGQWPPDYNAVFQWRQQQLIKMRETPSLVHGAKKYYRENIPEFINHWVDTYDPRNAGKGKPTYMPLIMFERQEELVHFLMAMMQGQENGLIEKCRDMGATWISVGFSVAIWLFWDGPAVGWGSRKEQLVDKIGDPSSIFEKMRMTIRRLPREFLPVGFNEREHMGYMRIVNPETGATITGEAGNNIGRGGRTSVYFKDESAHYEKPEAIEAALGDNTNVQIDISSVNGLGNVFHRNREAGKDWNKGPAHKDVTNVFIMDWSDHPEKTQEWYDARKAKAERAGLLHIFEQEVNRNYAASVEGVVIPADWVRSAIDAKIKLRLREPEGALVAALDVAEDGGDVNAFGYKREYELLHIETWGDAKTTGESARRAINATPREPEVSWQYDSIGVGSGVRSEVTRLQESEEIAEDLQDWLKGVAFTPWAASAELRNKEAHLDPEDPQSPLNKNLFYNFKAQAWWNLRLRFEKTHLAMTEGHNYPVEELISIPSTLPDLATLQKELSQATYSKNTSSLKMVINKTPEGTKSPNMADDVVMMFFPQVEDFTPAMMFLRKRA